MNQVYVDSALSESQLVMFRLMYPALKEVVSPGQMPTVAKLIGFEIEQVVGEEVQLLPVSKLDPVIDCRSSYRLGTILDDFNYLYQDYQWLSFGIVVFFSGKWHALPIDLDEDREESGSDDRLLIRLEVDDYPESLKAIPLEQLSTALRSGFLKSTWVYRRAGLGIFISGAIVIE